MTAPAPFPRSDKAGELLVAMPEGRHRADAAKGLAQCLALADEADEAIALASGLEEDGGGVAKARSSALATITFYLANSGNLAKAIEAAGGIRDQDQLGYALWAIAVTQVGQGDTPAAMRTVESIEAPEARIRALVGEHTDREHPGLAVGCARAGDQTGAKKCLERARALVATLPDGPQKDVSRASLALAEAQLGDVVVGLRQIRALLGTPEIRDIALSTIALIQAESGAWDDAYRTARSVSDPERRFAAIFQFGEAQLNAGRGDERSRRSASCWRPTPDLSSSRATIS